ncbi:MAG: YciI family protein [Gammaproteobacteria bacterium]|nr:YciI family protein [Gammaproteobacteria bacterium]
MFRYLVMAIRTPQFQPSVVEAHQEFLENLRLSGSLEMAGPFTDKTGGAYVLRASSYKEAQELAFTDPLHETKSSKIVVYEWNAK